MRRRIHEESLMILKQKMSATQIHQRIAEIEAQLPSYRKHTCSYDEREDGCPVCCDIDCLEGELSYLRYRQDVDARAIRDAELLALIPEGPQRVP